MPKINIATVPRRSGSGYPPPFDVPCARRTRQRLGEAGGLRDFGVNRMTLPSGCWSSQRHWHSDEDEEVGSRNPKDLTTCSDIDMMSYNSDGRFIHKDGKPYP